MDCKKLKEPSIRLKNPVKSSVRIGQSEKERSHSSHGLNTAANNTSPIMCAVCGSKEYITLHSQDKCGYPFGPSLGWNSPDLLKKSLPMEFPQTCGTLSPLAQAIFPHLSLFHFPSSFYCSHYNSNLRFPPTPCEPIEKYFGLDLNGSKAATVNSESTLYREREREKTKRNTRSPNFRNEESVNCSYKKDNSRPSSAFTNVSEVRNCPMPVHPSWMGNICPVFPYPWGFPFNQPMIPIYLPMSGKWQEVETRNDEDSASNTPMGDSNSVENETEKKSDRKDENNTSEYDFEVFARELMLEQKSNYDEDEVDIEVNLEEIENSLKTAGVNSGREINSEKFFNSKEKLGESGTRSSQDKDEMQKWRLSSDINMQDCCIRTLSNENLWYEAQDDDKKNWDNVQECNWKESGFSKTKHNVKGCSREKERIGDGVFHEANSIWIQDRCKTDESDTKTNLYWKKNSRSKEKLEMTSGSNERSMLSQTDINDEMEFSDNKINSLKDNSRLRVHEMNEQKSVLDIRHHFGEDTDTATLTTNRETTRHKEDNYSVQINTIEIEYSLRATEENRNRRKEEENGEFRVKEMENVGRDNINFNWDKINEILEEYNEKFAEVDLVLKDKQVLGMKMAKAYSLIGNRKQKNSHLTICDSSKSRRDNSENAHGDRRIEIKPTGVTTPSLPTSANKIKRDEKSKSFGFTSSKYESVKTATSGGTRKCKKQEETRKRWLT